MRLYHYATLATPLALLVACGGTDPGTALTEATPQYETLAMDMTSSDVTAGPSSSSMMLTQAAGTEMMDAAEVGDLCHPHLFLRSEAVAARVNRHLYKFLGHVEAAVARNPTLTSTGSVTWERTRGTVDVKFTIARTGTSNVYTWLLEMKPISASSFTTVFTGSIDRTGATRPHQGTGELTLDLTALHAVQPLEPAAGTIKASFSVTDASRKIVVDASDVTWDTSLETSGLLAHQPRAAQYVYYREPGKGGSLKIKDQMPFACPANPTGAAADVELVSRWYRTSTGSVHGRSDAVMTGGQLTGANRVVGVTCAESATESGDPAESFWLMKEEDGTTGATLPALGFSDTHGLSPCDPGYGAVPTLADPANDFTFPTSFADGVPYPFLPSP